MATRREPWASYQEVQQQTWGSQLPDGFEVLQYFKTGANSAMATHASKWREQLRFGRRGRIQRLLDHQLNFRARGMQAVTQLNAHGDLEVQVPDFIHWNGLATIAALQWVLAHREFDFILRINSSAYVNHAELTSFTAARSAESDIYAGAIEPGDLFWGTDFANGAAILMSHGFVQRIADHARDWDHRFTDDVSLGVMAAGLGLVPQAMPVLRISTSTELAALTADIARNQLAIRLKSTDQPRDEVPRMRRVHELISDHSAR